MSWRFHARTPPEVDSLTVGCTNNHNIQHKNKSANDRACSGCRLVWRASLLHGSHGQGGIGKLYGRTQGSCRSRRTSR
eukprot:1614684-Prymnesium_polylepis.1